jgi:hypothetical protein
MREQPPNNSLIGQSPCGDKKNDVKICIEVTKDRKPRLPRPQTSDFLPNLDSGDFIKPFHSFSRCNL